MMCRERKGYLIKFSNQITNYLQNIESGIYKI